MTRHDKLAFWLSMGIGCNFLACSSPVQVLRPVRPADLVTRYACGGGGHYAAETGITWYREWDGCYVKYPERVDMPHKLWTVGKMDYRPESIRGGPDNVVLDLPCPGTHEPDPTIIDNIVNGEKAHIRQTVEYSPAHRGNYWAVANEANWKPYFSPIDYAREFHAYATFIKGLDPEAKMTTGGLLVSNHFTGPDYERIPWYDWITEFRSEYQRLYGSPPPVDVWDIHPYDAADYSNGTTPARKAINNIIAMRQYLDRAGLTDARIWISEVACFTSDDQVQVDFINELFAWLNENADACKVDRWFWWGSTTLAFDSSGLFDGSYNRDDINVKGDAYMHQMGRVFVDPAAVPDTTRIKGSMKNPYAGLEEVVRAARNGEDGLREGMVVYDFSTGLSHVLEMRSAHFAGHEAVDGEDFNPFKSCITGPDLPWEDPLCADARLDGDLDGDQSDVGLFLRCLSGPGIPAAPGCIH